VDWALGGLGGHAQALSVEPAAPHRLAIGCGDGTIRLVSTGSAEGGRAQQDMKMIWQACPTQSASRHEDMITFSAPMLYLDMQLSVTLSPPARLEVASNGSPATCVALAHHCSCHGQCMT